MITKITLKNFKCFKDEVEFDFGGKNLVTISGNNSTGKTSFMESILFLLRKLTKDEDTKLEYYLHKGENSDLTVASSKYEFDINGRKMEYGIDFTNEKIIWEYLYIDDGKMLERGEEKAILYLNKPIVFEVEDSQMLFLKKLYLNTRFEGNDLLKKWFDSIKRFLWMDIFSGEIYMCNGKRLMKDVDIKTLDLENGIPLEMDSRSNHTYARIMPFIENMVQKDSIMLIDDLNRMFDEKNQEKILKYVLENNKGTQFFVTCKSDVFQINEDVVKDEELIIKVM